MPAVSPSKLILTETGAESGQPLRRSTLDICSDIAFSKKTLSRCCSWLHAFQTFSSAHFVINLLIVNSRLIDLHGVGSLHHPLVIKSSNSSLETLVAKFDHSVKSLDAIDEGAVP